MTSGCAAVTTTVTTTTVETPGTLKSTLSYPHRQAIDECGGICHPGSLPNGTILSNCTLSVTGLTSGVWYGVAIQVIRQDGLSQCNWVFLLHYRLKILSIRQIQHR